MSAPASSWETGWANYPPGRFTRCAATASLWNWSPFHAHAAGFSFVFRLRVVTKSHFSISLAHPLLRSLPRNPLLKFRARLARQEAQMADKRKPECRMRRGPGRPVPGQGGPALVASRRTAIRILDQSRHPGLVVLAGRRPAAFIVVTRPCTVRGPGAAQGIARGCRKRPDQPGRRSPARQDVHHDGAVPGR